MTTVGEGGMVTTNDSILCSLICSYKDQGKSREAVYYRDPQVFIGCVTLLVPMDA